jgi:class 3 adenylate cyclase
VRAALGRFGQVDFENDEARDQARLRLLRAARRLGVVPIGFVAGQLEPHRSLPRGSVTFLMCDIEGSTQLVTALGDDYGRLRTDIRRLMRAAMRRAGGREVDVRADEFFAVFTSAGSALEGAVDAQRAIVHHPWAEGLSPRLRMGLHTGRPTLTNSGYIGLAVHTVARVCAVGHGGQILLTGATMKLLGTLPADLGTLSLGQHRLAGLPEPVELMQVTMLEADVVFPPLRLG